LAQWSVRLQTPISNNSVHSQTRSRVTVSLKELTMAGYFLCHIIPMLALLTFS
jgi:hypothetical protein